MTKEEIQYEAQCIMQEWGSNDSAPYVEFVEKLASMKLPELQSDLDEATEDMLDDIAYDWVMDNFGNPKESLFDFDCRCFKAGAKWMAGQGYAHEVEVKEDAGGYPYIPCIELYDYDKDEPLFKPGDKVVVQIRKK